MYLYLVVFQKINITVIYLYIYNIYMSYMFVCECVSVWERFAWKTIVRTSQLQRSSIAYLDAPGLLNLHCRNCHYHRRRLRPLSIYIYVCNLCVCVGICVNRRGMVKNPIVIAVLCDVYTYYYMAALYATARVGFLSAAISSINHVHRKARRKQNNGTKK